MYLYCAAALLLALVLGFALRKCYRWDVKRGVRVLHFTDSHLCKSHFDPFQKEAAEKAVANETAALAMHHALQTVPHPHVVLLGGDQSDDGTREAYDTCLATFETFGRPIYYVHGNHDDAPVQEKTFREHGTHARHESQFQMGGWLFLLLDSTVKGEVAGLIKPVDMERVKRALAAHPQNGVCVVLHHHPVNVGTQWLDAIGVKNGQELIDILASHPKPVVVLTGHVHQDAEVKVTDKLTCLSTPSTGIQWEKGSKDAGSIDPAGIRGYRELVLMPDLSWKSTIHYVNQPVGHAGKEAHKPAGS